jgi:hypothetical protein
LNISLSPVAAAAVQTLLMEEFVVLVAGGQVDIERQLGMQ